MTSPRPERPRVPIITVGLRPHPTSPDAGAPGAGPVGRLLATMFAPPEGGAVFEFRLEDSRVAQLAIQGGRYAAKEIVGRLEGKEPQAPFVYKDKGSMATISKYSAVASIGKIKLTGFVAWLAWLAVHLMAMVGFKNRISTLLCAGSSTACFGCAPTST